MSMTRDPDARGGGPERKSVSCDFMDIMVRGERLETMTQKEKWNK